MNQKYLLQNSDGKRFTCVITPDRNEDDQWCEIFAIEKGQGFSVERWGEEVRICDYFAGETRATFKILSVEETDSPADGSLTAMDN